MYDREALLELIRQKALKFGDFTLASGKKATYYLDCKQVTLDPEGARLVGEGILDLLVPADLPDAIGGMAIGADPITASVVTMSSVRGTPLLGFMVRKEPKGHGTEQYLEGPVSEGDKVVVVEDVVVLDVVVEGYDVSPPVLVPLLLTAAGLLSVDLPRVRG